VSNQVRISLAVLQGAGRALDKAATAGARYYRQSVPVRTGRLKRSTKRLGSPGKLIRAWGSDPSAPYSKYVERGTRKMRARPRLKESAQVAGQVLLSELKKI
jgi:hypothetical protein